MTVKTVRQFVERQSPETENIICERCAGRMISAQMSADFFGFSCRIIFRLIETGAIHFVETARNEIYVCPLSVGKILNWANETGGTEENQLLKKTKQI